VEETLNYTHVIRVEREADVAADRNDAAAPKAETVRFEACVAYRPDAETPGGPCLACGWLDLDHEADGAMVAELPVAAPLRRAS
jgi:hypothetical protein